MKILITGANGMVARAAIDFCCSRRDEVLSYTRQDLDISDKNAVFATVKAQKPDAVINCAAYTDVDGSETNIDLCYAANAKGVENLALAAKALTRVLSRSRPIMFLTEQKKDFIPSATRRIRRAFMPERNSKAKFWREMLMRVRSSSVRAGFTAKAERIF